MTKDAYESSAGNVNHAPRRLDLGENGQVGVDCAGKEPDFI